MSKPKAPSDAARLSDVKQLFIDCQKADDDAAREKVLCASNPVLADEVRQLLDGIDEGEFIDRVFDVTGIEEPADLNATEASHAESSRSSGPRSSSTSSERPGCVIGNYKLLEQIGEGGMGTVFMAQQTHPVKRRVAVKIVKPGMDSRQVVARFEAERQALALMDHPNISRVFDGGTTEKGRPYFVMELVKGIPLTDFCQRKRLPLCDRLELFVEVCRAVQHAHQRGIIHRDLKPSNVLVTLHDGKPVAKIIDFGIAKAMNQELTDKTLFTQFTAMIGTPLYMSPEQAELSGLDVDTRSDVYSLGVMLYELLTATTPIDRDSLKSKGLDEVRRMIRQTEPPRPSERVSTVKAAEGETIEIEKLREIKRSTSQLKGELDWIAMKALEKDRERRYQSASDFADDIERHLAGETVVACPPSIRYRVSRYVRRHRILLTCASLVMLVAGLGTIASAAFANRARKNARDAIAAKQVANQELLRANRFAGERHTEARQRAAEAERANRQRNIAQKALYHAQVLNADAYLRKGKDAEALRTLLTQFPEDDREDLRDWEWYFLLGKTRFCDRGWYTGPIGNSAVCIADGQAIFTTGRRYNRPDDFGLPAAGVWIADSGRLSKQLEGLSGIARRSPDGSKVAVPVHATTLYGLLAGNQGVIQLVDLASDEQSSIVVPKSAHHHSVEWNRQGNRIAVRAEGGGADIVYVFRKNLSGWEVEHELTGALLPVGWSSNDEIFATTVPDAMTELQLYDGQTLQPTKIISLDEGLPYAKDRLAHWHPSEPWIALPTEKRQIIILNAVSGEVMSRLEFGQVMQDVRWSPNGEFLAAIGDQGVIDIWATVSWELVDRISAHETQDRTISWFPDSRRLVSMGGDGYCAIWSLDRTTSEIGVAVPAGSDGGTFAWAGNDTIQYTIAGDDAVYEFQVSGQTDRQIATLPEGTDWRLDHADLVSRTMEIDGKGYLEIRDLTGELNRHFQVSPSDVSYSQWAITKDRKQVVIATNFERTQQQILIDIPSGRLTEINRSGYWELPACQWSPDDQRVAFAECGKNIARPTAIVYDTAEGKQTFESVVGTLDFGNGLTALSWSPDGSMLVVGSPDGTCHVLDAQTGAADLEFRPFGGRVDAIAWHPQGNRIAAAGASGSVSIVDTESGAVVLNFDTDKGPRQLAWSPNGQRLAAQLEDGEILIWDAVEGYQRNRSSAFEQYRRERYEKEVWWAADKSNELVERNELIKAVEMLRPWVLRDSQERESEEVHPWTPDPVCQCYFYWKGRVDKFAGRKNAAVQALTKACGFGGSNRRPIMALATMIDGGVEVDGFESLVDKCYEAWRSEEPSWYRLVEKDLRESAQRFLREYLSTVEDQFATIYKLGKCNLAKVIEHRERAVQLDPVNANFLHRLASDYFDDSQIARAVETQERVVALRPDSEIAAQKLEEYRAALKD